MSSRSAFCAIGTLPIGNLIFARFTEIRTVSTTLPEEEVRFARDSPLEGTGFELSVPRKRRTMLFEIGAVRLCVQ